MAKEELTCEHEAWIRTLEEYRETMVQKREPNPAYVDPAAFITMLSHEMKEDAVYVADVGQNQIWSCNYHIVKKGRFLTSGGMGTMGYSIPAAMGAKRGDMDRQVVAVCGDGSFQMSMMELATIMQHHIPVYPRGKYVPCAGKNHRISGGRQHNAHGVSRRPYGFSKIRRFQSI